MPGTALLLLALVLLQCPPDDPNCSESLARVDRTSEVESQAEAGDPWWRHWLLDPARVIILTISLVLITHASQRAVQLDRDTSQDPAIEGIHNLTWYHVVCIPFLGSAMLLIFFYFFDTIQFLYTILCAVVSVIAMFNLLRPLVCHYMNTIRDHPSFTSHNFFVAVNGVTGSLAVVVAMLWVFTGHWLCLDVLGAALCVLMIQFVRVPSLKISTLLLLSLLAYDVFWVFYSSSIFHANVMVEVAIKKARNPVAVVADKLNMPGIANSRPSLSIPGKLLIPSLTDGKTFAILGLGDIVLPGLLLCFAMRFDSLFQTNGGATSHAHTKCLLFCQRFSYFVVALTGYGIGLLMASIVADMTQSAQPALLYLVPGVLVPICVKALVQGDFWTMWKGPFLDSTKVLNQKGSYQHSVSEYTSLMAV